MLAGSAAVCDWPANFFYKQLMEAYPDAKVSTEAVRKRIHNSLCNRLPKHQRLMHVQLGRWHFHTTVPRRLR